MGKVTHKRNPDTSTVETSANASENAGIVISAFDNSATADYFALITHGIDRHRLRIFNVRSGTVSNDYSAQEKEKITCLTWGYLKDTGDLQANTVQAFKKKKSGMTSLTRVIALGMHSGSIAFYSLSHGAIIKTLQGSHTTPITDFVMNKEGSRGYSVAEDNLIIEWDIEEGKELHKWKTDAKNVHKLKLSHNETKLATAGHTITLWDLSTYAVMKKFTGHASAIKEMAFSHQDDVLVSNAEDDRYVNVWDAQPNTNSNNITALTMETNVAHIDFSSTEPSALAVADNGLVSIWENASLITAQQPTNNKRKMMRAMTKEADAHLKLVSSESSETVIPIIAAKFVTDNGGKSIMIARGSSIKPSFEVVKYVDEETGAILRDITLTRQPMTNYLINTASIAANNLRTTRKAYDESTVTVIGNADFAIKAPTMATQEEAEEQVQEDTEPSIEQKLQSLDVVDATSNKAKKSNKKKAIDTPSAGSLQTVLVQALHSSDVQLLEACLQHTKVDVINNTIRRLPTQYLIPLLQEVIQRFQEKPARAPALLIWIKSILLIHTAYLMTVPDLVGKLSNFYQALDTRLGVFPKLLALRGRLDIVQSQVNVKAYSNINDKQLQRAQLPENVYVEMDSDDEAEAEIEQEDVSSDEDMADMSDIE
ncbi:WD40-repeat-containing domain protein [Gilbertella persicaria]|uniref:WD40-repeat-containing domain protein n=1 Tax=Gilbertella persicaria TaxID=101096 RepID=UPI0022212984|nr:WD40-repeat-containing domain protein [Gilbertella persicaria]KAI8080245.1 WD40-repeat-containing domain protein [Gilbertella persicaria]